MPRLVLPLCLCFAAIAPSSAIAQMNPGDSEPDDESKALLVELQKLVAQAGDLRAPNTGGGTFQSLEKMTFDW